MYVTLLFDTNWRASGIWNNDARRPCSASEIEDAIAGRLEMISVTHGQKHVSYGRAELRADGSSMNWSQDQAEPEPRLHALTPAYIAQHTQTQRRD